VQRGGTGVAGGGHTEVRGYERDARCKGAGRVLPVLRVVGGGAYAAGKPFTCAPVP